MKVPSLAERLSRPEHDPLTPEQVAELGERLIVARKNEDEAEKRRIEEELVNRHMRMIPHLGKTYRLDFEELLSIGALALTQAVTRWRPEKGSLYGYAERYITTAFNKGIDADRTIRIPEQISYKAARVQKQINHISAQLGRDLTREEKEQIAGDWARFEDLPAVTDSIDKQVVVGGETYAATLADTIIDETEDPYLQVERKMMSEILEKAIEELTPIEQEVIRARFGMNTEERQTLSELGDRYGVTGEAMRRLEATALSKLRHPSALEQIMD